MQTMPVLSEHDAGNRALLSEHYRRILYPIICNDRRNVLPATFELGEYFRSYDNHTCRVRSDERKEERRYWQAVLACCVRSSTTADNAFGTSQPASAELEAKAAAISIAREKAAAAAAQSVLEANAAIAAREDLSRECT